MMNLLCRDEQARHAGRTCRHDDRWCGLAPTRRTLAGPSRITLLHLSPYAPELNPVENVWAFLRSGKLSNRVFNTYGAIVDACCDAWTWLTQQPERITSIASRQWAKVSQ